ncbi:MAG: hypothetical protein ABS69_14140 [Nitrosomonadales bacterium SCN 54-20]|nr:MAG: hypothetical protein ABS69_14140 [Nitrosomonadales bacterium SCN 54-20]
MERLHPFHWSLPIMQKEIRKFVAAISTLGLLAGCSETGTIEAKKDDTNVPAQNIRPFVDHGVLARRQENRARKLLEIAAKREKRFQYYEDKSFLQGRHRQGSQAQAIALVQKYKLACKLIVEKATEFAFHPRTVPQLAKRDYIASTSR